MFLAYLSRKMERLDLDYAKGGETMEDVRTMLVQLHYGDATA